ncbi:uncharacterized protein [Drosophila suzukii]|uniref:Uncharacterized protein n=1 Tax=Drosophila suzukii TaxID=28584 RepID=A0ABM4TW06_DROSZ
MTVKKEEEEKNEEPGMKNPSFKPRRSRNISQRKGLLSIPPVHECIDENSVVRVVTPGNVRKRRAPVNITAKELAGKTRGKAGTVSPSIPTEEDSTTLQDAQFRQWFNKDYGLVQKLLSRVGLKVGPKARAKPRPKSGGKPVPKAVPRARATGASKGSARGAAKAGANEKPKVKTGTCATIRKRKEKEAKNEEPVVATVPKPPSGIKNPSFKPRRSRNISQRKGLLSIPRWSEWSRQEIGKAGTVSPSIPTEEDSTPLQEECNDLVSPRRKAAPKSHPRDAQFRQWFNKDYGQVQKLLSRVGLKVGPKARAKPRPKPGGKPVPKAVPRARATGASKGSARGAAKAGANEKPKVKTGTCATIRKRKEEEKNKEPVVATVPKTPSGMKNPSFKPRRSRNISQRKGLLSIPPVHECIDENSVVRVVTPGNVRKRRAPVNITAKELAGKTRGKAGTVSPSIPTEEDSTPLQEECNDLVSPRRKAAPKSHPRDAQFRQWFNKDYGQVQKLLSRVGLKVGPKARAKPRPKPGGKPVPKAVPRARATGASKGSARGAAKAGANEKPKVKTGTCATIRKRKEEEKNKEPVVATVPKTPSGMKNPSFKPRRSRNISQRKGLLSIPPVHECIDENSVVRVVTPGNVRKRRAPVNITAKELAGKTRGKAGTVSPSIPTEEDSTPLQEECNDLVSPRRKAAPKSSHPRDAQFRQWFNKDYGQVRKLHGFVFQF